MYRIACCRTFSREIEAAKDDGCLALVKFNQPRCRTCLAVGQKLGQMARRKPDLRIFEVDIQTTEGRQIVQQIGGVVGLPTITVYDRGELIYSKPVPVRLFGELESMIGEYEREVAQGSHGPRQLEDDEEAVAVEVQSP